LDLDSGHGEGGEAGGNGGGDRGKSTGDDRGGVLGVGAPALSVAGLQGWHGRHRLIPIDPPGLRQPAHDREAAPQPPLLCAATSLMISSSVP
jgi:hypothetical protein